MRCQHFLMIAAILMAGAGGCGSCSKKPTPFGRFDGEVVAKWDDDGRGMTLRQDFRYVDPASKVWLAPAGSQVNGASIPQVFWSWIGGPFEGQYRNASVVHDVYCDLMSEPWQDVHEMFYHACRCGGVEESEAKMLYWAVHHYGPRWEARTVDAKPPQMAPPEKITPPLPSEDAVNAAKEYFATHQPTLAEIRQLQFEKE